MATTRRGLLRAAGGLAALSLTGAAVAGCAFGADSTAGRTSQLLNALNQAVAARDRAGFVSCFVSGALGGRLSAAWFDNLTQLQRVDFRLTGPVPDDHRPQLRPWQQPVAVTWSMPFEAANAEHQLRLELSDENAVVRVSNFIPSGPLPIWAVGALASATGKTGSVLATKPVDISPWTSAHRRAVSLVLAAGLGPLTSGWDRRLMVEIAATLTSFAAIVGAKASDQESVGAIAIREGAPGSGAVRVLVNASQDAGLAQADREVLLTHEGVHVATRSPEWRAPLWVTEGLAERVALTASPAHWTYSRRLAAQAASAPTAPRTPPADVEFGRGDLERAYALARVGVDALFANLGQPRALGVIAAVAGGRSFPAAGVPQAALERWFAEELGRQRA